MTSAPSAMKTTETKESVLDQNNVVDVLGESFNFYLALIKDGQLNTIAGYDDRPTVADIRFLFDELEMEGHQIDTNVVMTFSHEELG